MAGRKPTLTRHLPLVRHSALATAPMVNRSKLFARVLCRTRTRVVRIKVANKVIRTRVVRRVAKRVVSSIRSTTTARDRRARNKAEAASRAAARAARITREIPAAIAIRRRMPATKVASHSSSYQVILGRAGASRHAGTEAPGRGCPARPVPQAWQLRPIPTCAKPTWVRRIRHAHAGKALRPHPGPTCERAMRAQQAAQDRQ
jgi:hypothetical protein